MVFIQAKKNLQLWPYFISKLTKICLIQQLSFAQYTSIITSQFILFIVYGKIA